MDRAKRETYIHRYDAAVRAIVVALDHVAQEELDRRPTKGAWSARQVVHHLADSELYESISLRRMLAENTPVLPPWDEERHAERLHYDRPPDASLEAFRATARANIELLERLTDDQWRREGNQQRSWPLTVEGWLEERVEHLHDRLMLILNAPSGGRAIPDP